MSRRKTAEGEVVAEPDTPVESNGEQAKRATDRSNPPRYWIVALHTGTGAVRRLGEYKTAKTARRQLEGLWGFASESFTDVRILKVKQAWPEIKAGA